LNRRNLLGAALATLVPGAAAAAARHKATTLELGDRLWMVTGLGGNVVVFDSPEGVLLVDGGGDGQAGELLKVVRTLTGKREVHTLFNTHWHHEQTGANTTLGPAGTRIIAHENTRLWLGTDIDSKWEKRTYTRLPKQARPTQTFYTTGSLAFGGETLDYGYLPQAHTDGDIHVLFRNANLLVAGDVVQLPSYPVIDTATNGWITGMVNGLQALSALGNDATRVVPARGEVVDRAALKEQSDMLVAVRTRLAKSIALGKSLEEARAMNPTAEFDVRWGDPTQFLANAWAGMVRRPQELGQAVV
jgi:cyclase